MLTIIKILSFVFVRLPPEISLYFARILGRIYFLLDKRHRNIAYHNLRLAFCERLSPSDLKKILKAYYLNMAENMVEVLYSPKINSGYIEKYIKIEGVDNLREAAAKNKSLIVTSAHFGNWEISNIICKYLFVQKPYFVLARDQVRTAGLAQLLDRYREKHDYKIVPISNSGLREAMLNLKKGSLLGMVIDQGIGRSSVFVNFFNHRIPAPTGAIKLALEFEAPLFLTYIRRIKGPYLELKIFPALRLKNEYSQPKQIQENSQMLNKIVEEFISQYPADYFWQFKRFKNKLDRKIVILNDSKIGHLRQSEAVAQTLTRILEERGLIVDTAVIDIRFKSNFARNILTITLKIFGFSFAFKYLKNALSQDCFEILSHICPDFVISAGSQVAGINLIMARENSSKPIVIMKPSVFSTRSFKLVISPWHDRLRPGPSVLKVNAAPNLINEDYLVKNSALLKNKFDIDNDPQRLKIGLFLGGDTKGFTLTKETVQAICDQLLSLAKKFNAQILVSSSRRTSLDIEALLKEKFSNQDLCKLLIIASENNIPEAVGGILGLCQIIIVSADSISMVSEAASSGKYTFVFSSAGPESLPSKHQRFLQHLKDNSYIYLLDSNIEPIISKIWLEKPQIKKLQDNKLIKQALEKII